MSTEKLTENSLKQHHILHPVLHSANAKTTSHNKEDHDSTKSLPRVVSRSELRKSFPQGAHDSAPQQLHRQFSKSSLGTTLSRPGLSFFRVIQAARTWKRLSLRKEAVAEKPKCMFENTYKLGPDPEQVFKPEKVEEVIQETLSIYLKNFKYTPEGSKRMCLNISSELKSRVKGMNFYRYKIVTQVVLLQNRQQGSNISSQCVWTPETDSFASCTFQTGQGCRVGQKLKYTCSCSEALSSFGGDMFDSWCVLWAQRKDTIYLTIQLANCDNPTITLKEDSLYFHGKGGAGNTEHEVLLEFNKEIDPDSSKHQNTGREINLFLVKKEKSRGFWPRLLKDPKKVHFLKTDFNKWKDEDDSDAETNDDFNLDEMMSSMGGLQGAGGPPDLDDEPEDSDDEDLPDLQE